MVRKELGHVTNRLEQIVKGCEWWKPVEPIAQESEDETELEPVKAEVDEELDPPKGIGLRFDEIEEMIDQVLSRRLI